MAAAVITEALLLSDTGLYDLERKSTEVWKEEKNNKRNVRNLLCKSAEWNFLKLECFIIFKLYLNRIHLRIS